MLASTPDLLRLIAVPVLGWAAWRDVKTRRVPNRTWYPLAALALVLLSWEGAGAWATGDRLFFLQVAISVGFIVPLSTAFWYMGSFGGADAKAFYVVALLFPVYPVFYLPWTALPLEPTPVGVFSLTVLSNTVVVGVAYPLAVALGNLLRGHVAWPMLIGKPVRWDETTEEYGVLLETPDGFSRGGLDLDALRMYLQWRGVSLADLRERTESLRDPATLPSEPNHPGDGGMATDGGSGGERSGPSETRAGGGGHEATRERGGDVERRATDATTTGAPTGESGTASDPASEDPWGAQAFLDDIEGSAYGTAPGQLREGLDVLTTADEVWISPGIPFLVPTFFGLLVSLTYGDVLFVLISALGFA